MKHIKNGGLELGILEAIFGDRPLTVSEEKKKTFLEKLPQNRQEWCSKGYDYYMCKDTQKIYREQCGSYELEELPDAKGKPIIVMSMKNKTGGFIHIDIHGFSHYDLYCEQKEMFLFLKECPY